MSDFFQTENRIWSGYENSFKIIPEFTIKYAARILTEIEDEKGFGAALLGAYSLNYDYMCDLAVKHFNAPENESDNNPNLMPSKYMIIKGASDQELDAEGNLSPIPFHPDEEYDIRKLKRLDYYEGMTYSIDEPENDGYTFDTKFEGVFWADTIFRNDWWSKYKCSHPWYSFSILPLTHITQKGENLNAIAYSWGFPSAIPLFEFNKDVLSDDFKKPLEEGVELQIPSWTDDYNPLPHLLYELYKDQYPDTRLPFLSGSTYYYPFDLFAITLYSDFTKILDPFDNPKQFTAYNPKQPERWYIDKELQNPDDIFEVLPCRFNSATWGIKGETFFYNGKAAVHPGDMLQDSTSLDGKRDKDISDGTDHKYITGSFTYTEPNMKKR
ncbi:MAG: hypothetical protein OCD01_00130 [Fibrobacterales bacterium]